jgi:hypothetical protein
MSLPSNWNKSRWVCKELGYHQYVPASPLKYGSFCRGMYECCACGKLINFERLQDKDIVNYSRDLVKDGEVKQEYERGVYIKKCSFRNVY